MNKITFPLQLRMQGPAVADLQDVLQLCLDRSALLANDEVARRELSATLKRERVEQKYGDATGQLVSIFQTERNLPPSGEIDEPTANALNSLLKEWGVLDQPIEPPTPQSFVVSGQVRREDGLPLQGMRVCAMHEANAGSLLLGEDTTDAEGRYTIRYELLPGVDSINLLLTAFDVDGKPLCDSDVIRGAKQLEIVDLIVSGVDITPSRVEGMVVKSAVMGKDGAGEGDTLADPTMRIEYNVLNWMNNGKPNFAHVFAREEHGQATRAGRKGMSIPMGIVVWRWSKLRYILAKHCGLILMVPQQRWMRTRAGWAMGALC